MTQQEGSRSSLVVERHYVPRSAPIPRARNTNRQPAHFQRQSHVNQDLGSPGLSSLDSNSPNGYIHVADTHSEISSMTGSVSSMPQPLDPSKLAYNQQFVRESDSGTYSGRQRYAGSTTSYGDTDLDSVTGESRDSRYRGELFQPKAAPRIVQRQVRQMYGEVHPKNLPSEDLPTPSSGDELETMSEASIPSFTDVPRVRPRASLRRKKLAELNSGFVSDDESSVASQGGRSKSLPRSILKSQTTDISDAESLATSGNFRRTASGRTVRFQHNDKSKYNSIPKKVIDYEKLDSEDSSSSKRKKGSSSDPFSMVKPVGIKPARNDIKRSSGRSSQRSSQKGKQGKQGRSSSHDRARSPGRKPSLNNGSQRGRPRSSSANGRTRTASTERKIQTPSAPSAAVKGEDVKIQIPESKSKSMISEMSENVERADRQKIMKWCLLIGVPVTLLIIVIIIVALLIRS